MDQSLQGPTGGGPVDWRGLCEEPADALACHYPGHVDDGELVNRVRTALAQPEPERYCQMIVDVQALAKRWNLAASWLVKLVGEVLAEAAGIEGLKKPSIPPALPDFEARAVLARYGHQPVPPVEGEVAELVAWLRDRAKSTSLAHAARRITRAADLLERRHPAPVPVAALSSDYREPWDMSSEDGSQCFASAILSRLVGVDAADKADARWLAAYLQANSRPQHFQPASVPASERLPGVEDCDAEGRCWWWDGEWGLVEQRFTDYHATHWLPATALPLPSGEVE